MIATDLFKWNNTDYIVVDYYSRYFEVEKITSLTSNRVIQKLMPMFARFGIPQTLISNNGPCYSSREFKDFARAWNFEHITSSPLYPQSNGMAERLSREPKPSWTKLMHSGQTPT